MRIVAFGDSYTYGHGLDSIEPGPTPSTKAWPSLLANSLNCSVVNYSKPGSSNFKILHTLLQTQFEQDDYVLIMWSRPERDMLFKDGYPFLKEGTVDIGSWLNNELFKSWTTAHSRTDNVIKSWYYIHHAQVFLQQLQIKHHNFFADYIEYANLRPKHITVNFTDIVAQKFLDTGLDGKHPGILTQQRYARDIQQCIV